MLYIARVRSVVESLERSVMGFSTDPDSPLEGERFLKYCKRATSKININNFGSFFPFAAASLQNSFTARCAAMVQQVSSSGVSAASTKRPR